MKRSELEERLIGKDGIDTGFKDEHNNKIGIDSFASFLITKNELKSNATIQDFFKDKKENFTPTDIVKNKQFKKESFDFPENEDDDKHFLSESFKFPDNFFNSDEDFNNEYMFVGLNVAERAGDTDYSNWGNFRDVKNPTNTFKLYTQLNDSKFKGCYITDIIKSVIDSDSGNVMRNFFIKSNEINNGELSLLKYPDEDDKADSQRANKLASWQNSYYKEQRSEEYKKVGELMGFISETYMKDKTLKEPYQYKFNYTKKLTGQQLLAQNKDILKKSIDCFVSECLIIHPKMLVVFGKSADRVLEEMAKSPLFKTSVDEREISEDEKKYVKKLVDKHRVEITHYAAYSLGKEEGEKGKVLTFKEWFEQAPEELERNIQKKEVELVKLAEPAKNN